MSDSIEARLGTLIGRDYKTRPVDGILTTISIYFTSLDVSTNDLLYVYDYLLGSRDSVETRRRVSEQLNEKQNGLETREKTEDVMRLLSEANPAYLT